MKILVTGGTGYIGSHTVIELINNHYDVEVLDNLANSKISILDKIAKITGKKPKFHQVDLLDQSKLEEVIKTGHYDLAIHFAGLKAVAESVEKPLEYYQNNLTGTINLLQLMQKYNVKNFIFSSSATVYGDPRTPEYTENLETGHHISSPYGETKFMIEQIMQDLCVAWPDFHAIALRYFNPIGNHPSGLIGEDPTGIPNNLMPYIIKVARGELKELSVYGNDYPTKDGTCRRDFIHVVDLAKGHLAAIPALTKKGFQAYNLGTGQPNSVLELIHAFEKASGQPLPYKFVSRRPGDLPEFWANPSLAAKDLGWHTELTLDDAMKDTITYLSQPISDIS